MSISFPANLIITHITHKILMVTADLVAME